VNDEGEEILHLFERTLDADTKEMMDAVIEEALALAQEIDFDALHDDDDDEDE
jgi:hypothetical protein